MRFKDNKKLDTSRIDDEEDGGKSGGGLGGLPGGAGRSGMQLPGGMGGGLGGILLLLVLSLVGGGAGGCGPLSSSIGPNDASSASPGDVQLPELPGGAGTEQADLNPTDLDEIDLGRTAPGEVPGAGQVGEGDAATVCRTGADANRSQQCRFVAVENSLQEFWSTDLPRRGVDYEAPRTNFFDGSVNTACGPADEGVGPFYCPADSEIYLARSFFATLEQQFGAKGGPFAEAYVLAHEFGHHIQNVLGISAKAQRDRSTGAESTAVRVELQADCFAGVWARNATIGPNPLIVEITEADIREGLDAAASVGDDNIQERMSGQVNPHTFSHGTSEQRQRWFLVGFKSGEMTDCDTFSATRL